MLHPFGAVVVAVAAGLQDVIEADEVGFDVGVGVGYRVTHSGLGGEVDDDFGPELGEKPVDKSLVCDVAFDEGPLAFRMSGCGLLYLGEAEILDCRVIVVVEAVYSQNVGGLLSPEKLHHEVGADKSGRACHKYSHNVSVMT